MNETKAYWGHRDIVYAESVVSHECYCSHCDYVVMRYSHMIQDFRAGRPYAMIEYNYCPNCGKEMEGVQNERRNSSKKLW